MPLEDEKAAFSLVSKRILKECLTKKELTLSQYKTDIIAAHNRFVRYVNLRYDLATPENQLIYRQSLDWLREKILLCFEKLELFYEFSSDTTELIDDSEVTKREKENTDEDVHTNTETNGDIMPQDQNNSCASVPRI